MKKMIYLDNAATTPTAPEVIEAMLPFYERRYGNPSALYDLAGRSLRRASGRSRRKYISQPEEVNLITGH